MVCGRYAQFKNTRYYKALLPVPAIVQADEREFPTWNLAPTQLSWAFRQAGDDIVLERLTWSLPGAGALHINARVETAFEKPTFSGPWRTGRCVIPADGWYEWTKDESKQPFYFHQVDEPTYLAGLFADDRFVLITGPATYQLAAIYDRRPVGLAAGAAVEWLKPRVEPWTPDELVALIVPEDQICAHPVGYGVSSTRNNGPGLIEPVDRAVTHGQLFG